EGAERPSGSAPPVLRRKQTTAARPDPLRHALDGDDDAVRELTTSPAWPSITLTPVQAARLIIHLLDGATLDDDERAGLDILGKMRSVKLLDDTLDQLDTEKRFEQLLDDYDGAEYRELLTFLSSSIERADVKGYYLDLF